jgi:hypothetical protein
VANENEGFSKRSAKKDFFSDCTFVVEPIDFKIFALTLFGVCWYTTFSFRRVLTRECTLN